VSTRVVGSELEAEAIVGRIADRRDWSPFFRTLEKQSGALDVGMREVWDQRFAIGIRHADATIEARAKGRGYYRNRRGPKATRSAPFLYWTGSELAAVSRFTTIDADKATIDPDRNYRGPLEGIVSNPFSDIVSEVVHDDYIFGSKSVHNRISRDLTAFLFKTLES